MAPTTTSNHFCDLNSARLLRLPSLSLHSYVGDFCTTDFVLDMAFGENFPSLERVSLEACVGPNKTLLMPFLCGWPVL